MKLYFPFYEGKIDNVDVESHPPVRNPVSGTILVVEDDGAVRLMVKTILENLGYEVIQAKKTIEALGIAARPESCIDLLLTDVVMPEMNGKELALRMAKTRPGLRCLFMSGYPPNIIAQRGILNDDTNFLQKPFSIDTLAEKIRIVLGQ